LRARMAEAGGTRQPPQSCDGVVGNPITAKITIAPPVGPLGPSSTPRPTEADHVDADDGALTARA